MLFKHYDPASGKVLKTSKPLLVSASKGYIRPEATGSTWWLTTTTIWPTDELIGRRIRDWRRLTNETGHSGTRNETFRKDHNSIYTGSHSVFPIPLAEWIFLRYGLPAGGSILDSFAGGPPRGICAAFMGYQYTGYEIRSEQIEENRTALNRLGLHTGVDYICGDGTVLDDFRSPQFDVALTCPPYYDLEKYSDHGNDLSNLPSYDEFNQKMFDCAKAHRRVMKPGSFVCLVVGNFRRKSGPLKGELIDFRGDTVSNFREAGFLFWQDVVLSKNFASASLRAANSWMGLKLVPRHEYLLVFKTPESKTNRR